MFIVLFAITFLYIVLYLRSRELEGKRRKGIRGIFDSIALEVLYLSAKIRRKAALKGREGPRILNGRKDEIANALIKLNPGEKREILYRDYLVGKLSLSLMVVFVGSVMAAGMSLTNGSGKTVITDGSILREDYNGEPAEYLLDAQTEDGDWQVAVTINPKRLSTEEALEILPDFYEKLGHVLAGKNLSLDEVSSDVHLVRNIDGYPFSVEWSSSDTSLVAAGTGRVSEVDEKCSVTLTANIRYAGEEYHHEYKLTIVPKEYPEEEGFIRGLQKLLSETEKESILQDKYELPSEYAGKKIEWKQALRDYSIYVFAGVIVVAVVIYRMSDKDLNTKLEEKKKKLKRAYPEILQKMVLYIGAGMTVRAAFQQISVSVDRLDEPVYKEMLYTCREMKSGVSEAESYFRFGRRCGLQEYIRLSTLLGQNLKRGSSNLLERLREETESAAIERIQNCRKAGEEAVTKLLLPMVMMLMVVMVMILLPAFSNMNI